MSFLRTGLATTVLVSLFIFLPISAQSAEVTIAWDANTDEDLEGYGIYFKKGSDGPPYNLYGYVAIEDLETSAGPTYTVGGLEQDARYYLALTAYDHQGIESAYSVPVCVDVGITVNVCTNPATDSSGDSGLFTGSDDSNRSTSSSGGSSVSCFIQTLGGKGRLIGWVRFLSVVCIGALIRWVWRSRSGESASTKRPGLLDSAGEVP